MSELVQITEAIAWPTVVLLFLLLGKRNAKQAKFFRQLVVEEVVKMLDEREEKKQ